MGAVHSSLDPELVRALGRTLPLEIFVETGTFQGDTTALMAPIFEKLYTVELSQELFEKTSSRLSEFANITMIHDASPNALARLRPILEGQSACYWLDAHWCGDPAGRAESECPLLDELAAIGSLNARSVVMIDDARFFVGPPPEPYKVADWPMLVQVVDALRTLSGDHMLWIVNDVLIFAPASAQGGVVEYSRRDGVDLYSYVTTFRTMIRARAGATVPT